MLYAFIDEAGQRATTKRSSAHFVMSAVILHESALPRSAELLSAMRRDLRRHPDHVLHWRNVKTHSDRLRAVQLIAAADFLTLSSVIVGKRHFTEFDSLTDDEAYLATLRLLLERLSWIGKDRREVVCYTLSAIVRFKLSTLRAYEAILAQARDHRIRWEALDTTGGRIDQPPRVEQLQLADFVASATFAAFEPDQWGNTEQRYLQVLSPRLYRRERAGLTSCGLKMYPWNDAAKSTYPLDFAPRIKGARRPA